MKKKVHVIINPRSGTSNKISLISKFSQVFDPHKYSVSYMLTGYAGHGHEMALEAVKENIDIVVAVGGDGTVNEIGRALIGTDTILGIIPLGSGNGLGRDLHIPINASKAIDVIAKQNVKEIDFGVANDHIFFCTCGVGFDAEVAQKALNQKSRGLLMYLKNILNTYFDQDAKEYEIECPNGTVTTKAFVVTCANAAQYGYNAFIAPHADIQDGQMNIIILKPLGIFKVPKTSLQLFTKKMDKNKNMVEIITSKATIKRKDKGVMHIDGDAIMTEKDIQVEIFNKGLKVFVP